MSDKYANHKWWRYNCIAVLLLFISIVLIDVQIEDDEKQIEENTKAFHLSRVSLPDIPVRTSTMETATPERLENKVIEQDLSPVDEEKAERANLDKLAQLLERDFSITLPSDRNHRAALGNFLYKCVGVGFGSIERSGTENTLHYLQKTKTSPSTLLRSVGNNIFEHERNLVKVYGIKGQSVRVYPSWFDARLSRNIANSSAGASLQQFSAEYALQRNNLILQNITINHRAITDSWIMAKSASLSCNY